MFDFERPNIEVSEISEDKKYGKFVVKPLERGYGITPVSYTHLCNDLRFKPDQGSRRSSKESWKVC